MSRLCKVCQERDPGKGRLICVECRRQVMLTGQAEWRRAAARAAYRRVRARGGSVQARKAAYTEALRRGGPREAAGPRPVTLPPVRWLERPHPWAELEKERAGSVEARPAPNSASATKGTEQ